MTAPMVAVLPVLNEAWAQPCIDSILDASGSSGIAPEQLLIIDNTRDGMAMGRIGAEEQNPCWPAPVRYHRDPDGHNLGVARSWNIGARRVLEENLDYLLIISASLRFGPILHTTWVEQMERFWDVDAIECGGHSWHLIAFHRRMFETVGLFDENYYPAYVEAIDFATRLRLMGREEGWTQCWVNAISAGVAYHVDRQIVKCPWAPLDAYYRSKWGGPKGEEKWALPFGDKPLDYWPEASIPELAERYELGEQGEGWW